MISRQCAGAPWPRRFAVAQPKAPQTPSAALHLTDELVDALNDYLASREEAPLNALLEQAPSAVQSAVRRWVRTEIPEAAEPATPDIGLVREQWFFADDATELEEHLDAAYTLGLGIRLSNLAGDGKTFWRLQLLSDEEFVPASGIPRTWPLPAQTPLLKTWNSHDDGGLGTALNLVDEANGQGHWVRLHTVLYGDADDEFEATSTSEFVVDIFDAPPPVKNDK